MSGECYRPGRLLENRQQKISDTDIDGPKENEQDGALCWQTTAVFSDSDQQQLDRHYCKEKWMYFVVGDVTDKKKTCHGRLVISRHGLSS